MLISVGKEEIMNETLVRCTYKTLSRILTQKKVPTTTITNAENLFFATSSLSGTVMA